MKSLSYLVVSMYILSGCTHPATTKAPLASVDETYTVEIFVLSSPEKTAQISTNSVGVATRIDASHLITTAHTFTTTGTQYAIRDAHGQICPIIDIAFAPIEDVAVFNAYGSCTGKTLMYRSDTSCTNGSVQGRTCALSHLSGALSIYSSHCTFSPGMSGTPLLDTQHAIIGLVQGTDTSQGYIVLFSRQLIDWINTILDA